MAYDTIATILQDVTLELGLPKAPDDPIASTDVLIQQLVAMAKSCGRMLVKAREWTNLVNEANITLVAGQETYPLPDDFRRMIDQTWWNRTTRLPALGPLTPQEWQYLKARMIGVTFSVLFRPAEGVIRIYSGSIPAGHQLFFEYLASSWVKHKDGTKDTKFNAPDDLVLFDPLLFNVALRLRWKALKQFDTTAEVEEFKQIWDQATSDDQTAAPRLNLAGGRVSDKLLDASNIPTSFGGGGSIQNPVLDSLLNVPVVG